MTFVRPALFLALIAVSARAAAEPDPRRGAKLYGQCAACHAANGSMGPDLVGVVGRKAGTRADYRYSTAMKSADFVWSEAKLRAFLHDPQDIVPNNKMPYGGMPSDRDADDVIAYLSGRK